MSIAVHTERRMASLDLTVVNPIHALGEHPRVESRGMAKATPPTAEPGDDTAAPGRRILVTGLATYWGGRLAQALEQDPGVEVIVGVDSA